MPVLTLLLAFAVPCVAEQGAGQNSVPVPIDARWLRGESGETEGMILIDARLGRPQWEDTSLSLDTTKMSRAWGDSAVFSLSDTLPVPDGAPQFGAYHPGRTVTLEHLWIWSETEEQFVKPESGFPTIRSNQPTYVLTHGWDGDLAAFRSMSSVGCAIREAKPDVNLLAWDWSADANPNGRQDFEELKQHAKLIDFLTFFVLPGPAFDPIGAARRIGQLVGDGVVDAINSGTNARYQGTVLGNALAGLLYTDRLALGTELHLIGKSHGGGVMGRAAQVLKYRGYRADSLTTLDTPRLLCNRQGFCHVDSLANVVADAADHTAVFYYTARLHGGFGAPVDNRHGALTNLRLFEGLAPLFSLVHLWISGPDKGPCPPSEDDGWYPWLRELTFSGSGVVPSALWVSALPAGNYQEFARREFAAIGACVDFYGRCTETIEAACHLATYQGDQTECPKDSIAGVDPEGESPPQSGNTSGLSLLRYDPFDSAETWFGNFVELVRRLDPPRPANRAVLLRESGDASFFKAIPWPEEALYVTFDYNFLSGGNETLTVYLNDGIVYYDSAGNASPSGEMISSGPIYCGHLAGTVGQLAFVLGPDGAPGGGILIDNVRVLGFRRGDADLDGDRDLADFAALQHCVPPATISDTCATFDRDATSAVERADLSEFLQEFSGPSHPPIP